jgi:Amt family ammonium transporter
LTFPSFDLLKLPVSDIIPAGYEFNALFQSIPLRHDRDLGAVMSRINWPALLALLVALILLGVLLPRIDEIDATASMLALALAFAFPVGLILISWTTIPPYRAAGLTSLAFSSALIAYYAVGFALQYGGVAAVSDADGLHSLSRFFSLMRGDGAEGWGVAGLDGFFLDGGAATQAALRLFLSQLPLVISVALVATLALPRRTPPSLQFLVAIVVSAVTYPIAGHWVTGGGWLSQLGQTLSLGHGLVDFAGIGSLFVVGAATAVSASLLFERRRTTPAPRNGAPTRPTPANRSPLAAVVGMMVIIIGWIALTLANPLLAESSENLNWPLIALNALAGLAGGIIQAQLFSWFTAGRFDPLMGPRGGAAGLVAASAGAPFFPTWAAFFVGAIAGGMLPLSLTILQRLPALKTRGATIAIYGLPALWGLMAVALFADGRWGQGWNGTTGNPGQGVTGLVVPQGVLPDGGQLAAQLWGGVALMFWGFLMPWGLAKLATLLFRIRIPQPRAAGRVSQATLTSSVPSGERQSASRSLDGIVNVDEGR